MYREPDDIQMLPNLSDINIRKNSPTHRPRSFPVSTPCSQATFGYLLLQPLLISPTTLLHLAFQPVQFLLRLLATSSVPKRGTRMRERMSTRWVDSLEKGVDEGLKSMRRVWRIP
jgi:hypothetical protein